MLIIFEVDKKYEADELFIKTIAQSYLDYDGRCLCHYLHWCFGSPR